MIQNTYILDTNVYGEILVEENREELVQKIETTKAFLIYGIDAIEKELSETPNHVKYRGEATRKLLLTLYKSIIDETINVTPLAKHLAGKYFKKYKELAKSGKYELIKQKYNEKSLKTDFQIIAIASISSVDIVVSSDKRTMLSQLAKDVYAHINKMNNLKTPELLEYKKFKEVYLKWIQP